MAAIEQVLRTDIDHIAPDGLGRVDGQVEVLDLPEREWAGLGLGFRHAISRGEWKRERCVGHDATRSGTSNKEGQTGGQASSLSPPCGAQT